MRCATLTIVGGFVVLASSSVSRAQVPPFNGGGAFAWDPEIGVVNSGALLDAQVVVSADRKYVTINARPSLSRLNALNVFPAVGFGFDPGPGGGGGGGGAGGAGGGGAQLGFVGGAGYIEDEIGPAPGTPKPEESAEAAERRMRKPNPPPVPATPTKSSPSEILKVDTTAANSVLRKEGMHKIE